MKKLMVWLSILCIGISLIGCEKQQAKNDFAKTTVVQNDKIENTKDFINLLNESGYKIKASIEENGGTLSGHLTAIDINDDNIFVYEYKDSKQMEEDLNTISDDGSMVGNAEISWIKPPHLYKSGNIIAIYVGDNKEIIDLINKILGQQFAGV